MKNRGLILQQFGNSPLLSGFEDKVSPQSVVIKVEQTGICGTDIQFLNGTFPLHDLPAIFGHEIVGKVLALGDVTSDLRQQPLSVGDRVVVASSFHQNCGSCQVCTVESAPWSCKRVTKSRAVFQGLPLSKFGGGFAEKLVLSGSDRKSLLKIDVDADKGVLFEPLSIACEALSRVNSVHMKDVVVLGSGTIGLLMVALLKNAGARTITVVGAEGVAEQLATRHGATSYFPFRGSSNDYPPSHERLWSSDGMGAHYVFEFTGSALSIRDGLALLRTNGILVTGGVVGGGQSVALDPYKDLWERNLTLQSLRGRAMSSFVRAAGSLEVLPSSLVEMIGERITLMEAPRYFEAALRGDLAPSELGVKTVISLE